MDRRTVDDWIRRYVTAWNTNDPNDIASLFVEDATYLTGPFDEPWRGRNEIAREWLGRKDAPGTTEFTYEILAIDGDLAVIEGRTTYSAPERLEFGNIWVIRLDDSGCCEEFTEWWMQKP